MSIQQCTGTWLLIVRKEGDTMGINLQKGQKIDLTKSNPGLSRILIGLGWNTNKYSGSADFDLDATAFMLGKDGRVTSNKDFVYYGNLKDTSGSVEHMGDNLTGGSGGDDEQIRVNLSAVPMSIEKINFAVTIYEAEIRGQNFGQVGNAYIRIINEANGMELLRYNLGEDFSIESALVVGEIYRYNGEWKFNAIGSGYKGGLHTLCQNYGVNMQITDRNAGAIELQKGQKVSLEKRGASLGEILINLNWNQPQQKNGLFAPRIKKIDLDLGCLYELEDGRIGCVQALGNSFGSMTNPPYVSLDGDDRTGASINGENLRINGAMTSKIKRILVYTFIYEGAINWKEAQGIVTVKCPGNKDIIVKMDEYGSAYPMCAIALFENKTGDTFSVEKIVQFFRGHQEMDRAFHWGLRWVAGRK